MEIKTEHETVVAWLSKPQAYCPHPERVEHVETHISDVFLAGDYVYKLKKPVQFDFLDFTSLAARELACREEVRLNSRLAADTYLGILPIYRSAQGIYRWDGEGEVVDWVVQMRRLPTERCLDALQRRGELRSEQIAELAAALVRFYEAQKPLPLTAREYLQRVIAHVRANRRELLAVNHHLPRGVVERVHGFQLQCLLLSAELFEERVRAGKIVDGHGDLRPEHICFSEPLAIFDCIEFNAEFRSIDVADELAFLAAECDFSGAEWVGPYLLRLYEEQSGDRLAPILVNFYKTYRACVRAKVAALRADQLQGEPQNEAAAEAQRHLELADRYSAPWVRPLMIAVGGAAGTGKTTLAKHLCDALGAELLRTDVIRQEIYGVQANQTEPVGGIYSQQAREQVYDETLRRAAAWHAERIPVILDGTFSTGELMRRAHAVASHARSIFLGIECVCRREIAHERIQKRLAEGRDASEAEPAIHDVQRSHWEPWPTNIPQMQIDSEQPVAKQVEAVMAVLAGAYHAAA